MEDGSAATARADAVLATWAPPAPTAALAYRPLAEAVTGVACPMPAEPDEVDRAVALARRNREYSAAHTDAMLPHDPPLLPGLLARREAIDAAERAAFRDRLVERERRLAMDVGAVAADDLWLATTLRDIVLALAPEHAAVLCLLHGLGGDRPLPAGEVARRLGTDPAAVRRLEADALAALRRPERADALRAVLETAGRGRATDLSLAQTPSPSPLEDRE